MAILASLLVGLSLSAGAEELLYRLVPVRPVEILRTGETTPLRISEPITISAGTKINTRNGAAELHMPDGSKLLLAPFTQLDVQELGTRSTSFRLLTGHLRAAIAGLFTSKMRIQTPTAVAAVRGTEFDITAGGPGGDRFEVADGALEVSRQGDNGGGNGNGPPIMVTSEESLHMPADPSQRPQIQGFGLRDDRAQPAARPFVVHQENGRDATKALFAELRGRELKANEAQLGKSVIDAHGNRVRMEQDPLRPDSKSFKFLFLSRREDTKTLDWGSFAERFANPLPNDLSRLPDIVAKTFMSPTMPSNWLKFVELYMTNQTDIFKQTITLADPTQVDFAGLGVANLGGTIGTKRFYPGRIDKDTFLGGPGVISLAGVTLTGGLWQTVRETQVFGVDGTVANTQAGKFVIEQKVVNNSRVLTTLINARLNPTTTNGTDPESYADYQAGGGNYLVDKTCDFGTCDTTVDPITVGPNFPAGPRFADQITKTTFRDGTTLEVEKLLVRNDGKLIDFGGGTLPTAGSFNMEFIVGSNRYTGVHGGKIDLLIAPEIFGQTAQIKSPDQLKP